MGILIKLEVDKNNLSAKSDFTIERAHRIFVESTLEKLTHTNLILSLS